MMRWRTSSQRGSESAKAGQKSPHVPAGGFVAKACHPVEGDRVEHGWKSSQEHSISRQLAQAVNPILVEPGIHLCGNHIALGHEQVDCRQASECQEAEGYKYTTVSPLDTHCIVSEIVEYTTSEEPSDDGNA